jgi:hypothetical protein
MAAPHHVTAVACTPHRADRPTTVAVVVSVGAARRWHDDPAARGVHQIADEVVREVVATRIGHGDVVREATDAGAPGNRSDMSRPAILGLTAVNSGPTLIGMQHLDRQEKACCMLAARVLDVARAEAWDIRPHQGRPDVMLTHKDGRRAALEVTNLGDREAFHMAGLLAGDNYKWPLPGQWMWSIQVGSAAGMRRLKRCYQNIIRICEAANVQHPENSTIAYGPSADPDLQWLVEGSGCHMMGHSDIPAAGRSAMVTPLARGGWVDDALTNFANELSKAFQAGHITPHFEKLDKEPNVDERHLFIPLHESALPFNLSKTLTFEDTLPSEPPPVPNYITHLWLAPAFGKRVLLWTPTDSWINVAQEPLP